jgi:hypothetical protein
MSPVDEGLTRDVGELSQEERAWLEDDEALWQRAHRIVEKNPLLDPSDVYHTLRAFRRSPSERLRRGLRHGRARTRTQ